MRSKVFGSTLIIAGTTIGAGMLALPLSTAAIGFYPSIALMAGMWMLMSYTALLMLEVHQYAPQSATLSNLAEQFLGKKGYYAACGSTLFLLYALCAAYIAGGGGQMQSKLVSLLSTPLPPQTGALIFTLMVAVAVMLGTSKVDAINRVLFGAKIILLALSLFFLLPEGQSANLLSLPPEKGLLLSAIPVMFTSFGFHSSIPSVVAYTGLNIRALRKIMLLGSAQPLLVYVLWQAASFGVLGQAQLTHNQDLTQFISAVGVAVDTPQIPYAISLFADLALATSFLGVSLGLFDFINARVAQSTSGPSRFYSTLITFVPPLVIALFYPQGFVAALGYAAIALAVLAVLLPALMVQKARKLRTNRELYQVFGGNIALSIAIISGLFVIASQLAHGLG